MFPITPDRRYLVIQGQLWRCSNPALSPEQRQQLVDSLMNARRQIRQAKATHDDHLLTNARKQVQATKVALGERGPAWWTGGAPDYNRHKIENTPYIDWFNGLTEDQKNG